MTLLAIEWSSFFVKTGQFILSFSILVVLHELGHFIPARIFKCRVEKFYLFFNPWFSLWKTKKGETEYGLGWIPFGGYVKISGMVDESMDKEQMKLPPQPYEFRSKKAWQRLIIMVGGVIVNILLAIVIFIGIMWKWGEEYLPAKNLKYGIVADSLGKSIGLKDGDNIVSLDGKVLDNFNTIGAQVILNESKTIQVMRDNEKVDIAVPNDFAGKLNKSKLEGFVDIRCPYIIDSVTKEIKIQSGSLLKGDRIIGTNGKPTLYFHEYAKEKAEMKTVPLKLTILRNDKDTVQTTVMLTDKGLIGVIRRSPDKIFETVQQNYTLLEAIPAGFHKCFQTLDKYITGLKQLFTGKVAASDSLGSVISIGKTFPAVWDWQRFWMLTGIFSIILAFMNILPIPALDGGHALFTLVEMITGRKPSDKFMEYAQTVGMVLLLGLMAYALGLDFWRLFK